MYGYKLLGLRVRHTCMQMHSLFRIWTCGSLGECHNPSRAVRSKEELSDLTMTRTRSSY